MADREPDDTNWGNYLGYGLQMAVGVGLGVLIGLWVDRRWNCSPIGVIAGSMLGLGSSMYLLIKDAIRINRD